MTALHCSPMSYFLALHIVSNEMRDTFPAYTAYAERLCKVRALGARRTVIAVWECVPGIPCRIYRRLRAAIAPVDKLFP